MGVPSVSPKLELFAFPQWSREVRIPCPYCKYQICGNAPDDQRLFNCPMCRAQLQGREEDGKVKLRMNLQTFLASPQISFIENKAPWPGEVMSAVPYSRTAVSMFSCWVEPEIAGQRVITAITADGKPWPWTTDRKGLVGAVIDRLKPELEHLASILRFNGDRSWMLGAAVEGVLTPDGAMLVYHAMPLTSLICGSDCLQLSVRQIDLQEAVSDLSGGLLRLMPQRPIKTTANSNSDQWTASEADLDKACQHWNVPAVIIKQNYGMWRTGANDAWMRYEESDL